MFLNKAKYKIYRLLRLSEKFTKTDMVYLAKGGTLILLGQIISVLMGLTVSTGFANLIPKNVFGNYCFIISLAGIIGTFTLTGMRTAIAQSVSRGYEGTLKVGFRIRLKWNLFASLFTFGISAYYAVNNNMALSTSFLIIAFFMPFRDSAALYSPFLAGKRLFGIRMLFNSLWNIITAIVLLTTISVTHNVAMIILSSFVTGTVLASLFYIITLKRYVTKESIDYSSISYAKYLSIINIVGSLSSYIDKVLIFKFFGATELAVYSFSTSPVTHLRGGGKLLRTLSMPKFSVMELTNIKKTLFLKIFYLFIFYTFITFLYILSAPYIYNSFFPEYIESVRFSQIYALGLLTAPISILSNAFVAHKKTREIYYINIIIPLMRIILLIVLAPIYGIWGAVIALLVSHIFNAGLTIFLFKRMQ